MRAPVDDVLLESLAAAQGLEFIPMAINVLGRVKARIIWPYAFQAKVRSQNWPALGPRNWSCTVSNIEGTGMDLVTWLQRREDTKARNDILVRVG